MKPVLFILVGATILSFTPVIVMMVSSSYIAIAFYRCLFACFCFAVLSLVYGKQRYARIEFRSKYVLGLVLCLLLSSFTYSLDLVLWNEAIHLVGVGTATFLNNLQILFSLFLAYVFLTERPPRTFYFFTLLCCIGLALIFYGPKGIDDQSMIKGFFLGITSAVLYTLFLFFLRMSQTKAVQIGIETPTLLALQTFFSCVYLAIAEADLNSRNLSIASGDLVWLMVLGIVCHFLGWLFVSPNLSRVSFSLGASLVLLQPVLSLIWGNWFFNESYTAIQYLGFCCVFFGLIFMSSRTNVKKMQIT